MEYIFCKIYDAKKGMRRAIYFVIGILLVGFVVVPRSEIMAREEFVSESIQVALTGDVMIGRLLGEKIGQSGYKYPWGDLLPRLKNADLTLVNLETTLTTSTKRVPKVFNYKANPDRVQSLVEAGVDVANLANNHMLDFAEDGLLETIATLDKAGIAHVGAGVNREAAQKPVILKKKGITIGIIGITDNEPTWEAREDQPGTNYVKVGDLEKMRKQISALKKKVDVLILSIHWGPNMREVPTKAFKDFAHHVMDLGVDIFHGHSAHIFQGIEIYNNKLILYDTGDFVDDYAVDPMLRNDRSFLYLVELKKDGVKNVQLLPVRIGYMQVNKASREDYRATIERIKRLSEPFGTKIEETDQGVFVRLK